MKTFEKEQKGVVKKIVDIKGSGLLNGMALLSETTRKVLIADTDLGGVWKINVGSGEHDMAIQIDEMMKPAAGLHMGINGIKIRDGYLYWTNTGRKQCSRIKIDGDSKAAGGAEVLAEDCLADDFCFDEGSNVWITQNVLNTIVVLKESGELVVVAGQEENLDVCGGTACLFGRTKGTEHLLYVTTTGGLAGPIGGTLTEGGKVVAVDTNGFSS